MQSRLGGADAAAAALSSLLHLARAEKNEADFSTKLMRVLF
jgi:hypothetical protein